MATNAWDRLPKETLEAYEAFLTYRDLGSARSHEEAARASGRHKKVLARWSTNFDWVGRVRAYDDHLAAERQKGIDRATRDEAAEWEKRRQGQMRADYELSQEFLRKVRTLVGFPVTDVKSTEDGKVTIISAIKSTHLKDAAAIAQAAQAMAWAAIHQAIPPDEDDFDPEKATPEECRAYLERKGRLRPPGP